LGKKEGLRRVALARRKGIISEAVTGTIREGITHTSIPQNAKAMSLSPEFL